MKAIILEEHGDVDQLKLQELSEKQSLEINEIEVDLKYCALNHLDLWLRRGGTGDKFTFPIIPGSDMVGVVKKIGSNTTNVTPGDTVLIYPGVSCGHCDYCNRGNETQCLKFEIIGYNRDGGYAQKIRIPSKQVVKIPNENLNQWAAVPIAYVTAWNALVTKADLNVNDTIVIWGASGGLGYAALSIARGINANIIAIVGSEDKEAFLRNQGFEGIVIQRSEDVVKKVREYTNNKGADVVLDHAGKATWNQSLKMLGKSGRLAFCGITTGAKVETDLRYIFAKQISIYGSWMGDKKDFNQVVSFLTNHPSSLPHIDRTFLLEDVGEAHSYMEKGIHKGKIILLIPLEEE